MVTVLTIATVVLVLALLSLVVTVFARMVSFWRSENAQVARSDRQYNEFMSEWARRRNQK